MRTTTKSLFATTLCAITLFGPGAARAVHAEDGVQWSSVASGCVLDSASVGKATTRAVFGDVTFKGSQVGRIRLACPVSGLIKQGPFNVMSVNYVDPDGAGTTCQIKAFLLRTNTNELERGNTIVGFDSNTGFAITEPGTGRSWGRVGVPELIDSDANYYWIDLELLRSTTACNPTAAGVHLDLLTIF